MSDRRGVVVALHANANRRRPQEPQKIRCVVRIIEPRSHYWSQRQNAESHITSGVRGNVVPTKQEKNKAFQKFLSATGKNSSACNVPKCKDLHNTFYISTQALLVSELLG